MTVKKHWPARNEAPPFVFLRGVCLTKLLIIDDKPRIVTSYYPQLPTYLVLIEVAILSFWVETGGIDQMQIQYTLAACQNLIRHKLCTLIWTPNFGFTIFPLFLFFSLAKYSSQNKVCCQTPDLGQGLEFDFTFAMDNKNKNNKNPTQIFRMGWY